MALWIKLVGAIFKRRGMARQERLDTWLTNSTPERNWKDRNKEQYHGQRNDEALVPGPG